MDNGRGEAVKQATLTPAELKGSPLVRRLLADMREANLPEPTKEYQFDPTRRWRADLAYPELHLLIEVEGGRWTRGRHTRGGGFANDIEKYNKAASLGFTVLRFTDLDIKGGYVVKRRQSKGVVYKVRERVEPRAVSVIEAARERLERVQQVQEARDFQRRHEAYNTSWPSSGRHG
jgi:very-short-patch-repair endonuclease